MHSLTLNDLGLVLLEALVLLDQIRREDASSLSNYLKVLDICTNDVQVQERRLRNYYVFKYHN